jgi:phenylalanyl-tRNA synthetase beta chain
MKLSLSWIFEHIDADWKKQDIPLLVEQFNKKTAEIEGVEKLSFDKNSFAIALCNSSAGSSCTIEVPEWSFEGVISSRNDAGKPGDCFLVKKDGNSISWATLKDFNQDRDILVSPLCLDSSLVDGGWKELVEWDDVILDVDNKSVTHRPDMWGHRGFAREVAMLLDLPFKDSSKFLEDIFVKEHPIAGSKDSLFKIKNEAPDICKRFSAAHFSSVEHKSTPLQMAFRLLFIGAKPINALVDLTNYVMLDWSQPVHAYDAKTIEEKEIVIRKANNGEKLLMLDETELELTAEDLVVASKTRAMALAGVMGGMEHSVGKNTTQILFESANFDASSVRRSAFRHKVRTESSARFEKTLCLEQVTEAAQRFLKLAKEFGVEIVCRGPIDVVGKLPLDTVLEIEHKFFEEMVGTKFDLSQISGPLKKLEFGVEEENLESPTSDTVYKITVPPFRASKDVRIKEDVLEEVVRCFGFDKIDQNLPAVGRDPVSLSPRFKVRAIKRFLANGAGMMEQANYSFIDEEFVRNFSTKASLADGAIEIFNPVSENARRLVTTLIPGLLKNVCNNYSDSDSLSFFEVGRIWAKERNNDSHAESGERMTVSGIAFEKNGEVGFYDWKERVEEIFKVCQVGSVKWSRPKQTEPIDEWWHPYQSAELIVDGRVVGIAGKVSSSFWPKLGLLPGADAFIFEIDAQFLADYSEEIVQFKKISKFQENNFDLSFMVPIDVSVDEFYDSLIDCHSLVKSVDLLDFFEKDEWLVQRSLAFRVTCGSSEKTLDKDEIEAVRSAAVKVVEVLGAQIRS